MTKSIVSLGLLFGITTLAVSADTIAPQDNHPQLTIKAQVYEKTADGDQLIAEPELVTNWNESAQVTLAGTDGKTLSIEVKTSKE